MKFKHDCTYDLPSSGYGVAVSSCVETDEGMFVGNGEYESRVNYCPFCGKKSDRQVVMMNNDMTKKINLKLSE